VVRVTEEILCGYGEDFRRHGKGRESRVRGGGGRREEGVLCGRLESEELGEEGAIW
jgi:hypothetical protein